MADGINMNDMIGCGAHMDPQAAIAQAEDAGTQQVRYRDMPDLLDTDTGARILNVNVRTVTRMCAAGRLKAVKVMSLWRINRDALLAFAGIDADAPVPAALLD